MRIGIKWHLVALLIAASLIAGRNKVDPLNPVSAGSEKEIKVVAHRGASKFAPENTIAALKKAHEMGADYAEIDVRMTRDGRLVLLHDQTVDRTTDGHGKVRDLTLEEIKDLDAGSWFAKSFEGEEIPTFREALRYMKGKIIPDIDFKSGNLKAMIKVLREENFLKEKKVIFFAGSGEEIKEIRKMTDNIRFRVYVDGGKSALGSFQNKYDPEIINVNEDNFSQTYVRKIKDLEMKIFMATSGTKNYEKNMRKGIDGGVDFLLSDNIDVLINLIEDRYKR